LNTQFYLFKLLSNFIPTCKNGGPPNRKCKEVQIRVPNCIN